MTGDGSSNCSQSPTGPGVTTVPNGDDHAVVGSPSTADDARARRLPGSRPDDVAVTPPSHLRRWLRPRSRAAVRAYAARLLIAYVDAAIDHELLTGASLQAKINLPTCKLPVYYLRIYGGLSA